MPEIDRYFDVLLERGGSDLHLSIGYPPMIRAKGDLVAIANEFGGEALHGLVLAQLTAQSVIGRGQRVQRVGQVVTPRFQRGQQGT